MAAKKKTPPVPDKHLRTGVDISNRPLQWDDLNAAGRQHIQGMQGQLGNFRQNLRGRIETLAAKENPSNKERVEHQTLTNIEPYARDRKVSIPNIADSRISSFLGAAQYARARDEPVPAGTGWYYEHHGDLAGMAQQYGAHTPTVITASATMSPLNSPDNEKAAVGGLLHAQAHGKVYMSGDLHDWLSGRKKDMPVVESHRNKWVDFGELHPDVQAHITATDIRDMVKTKNVDLEAIGKGGPKENISKAAALLRGDAPWQEAIDPHSAPKIWTYANNTRDSVPNTPEHQEYMARTEHATAILNGHQFEGNYPHVPELAQSTEGMLSPKRGTVMDTWMNAQKMQQPNVTVPGTKSNVYKTAGSLSIGQAGNTAQEHAYNDAGTHLAAERLGKLTPFPMPSGPFQEVPWIHERREAGKDTEYNKRLRDEPEYGRVVANLGDQFPDAPRSILPPRYRRRQDAA